MKSAIGVLSLVFATSLFGASTGGTLKNEFFMFSGSTLSVENARYENRFIPYNLDTGEGLQVIEMEDKSVPVVGVGFTHHFNRKWSLQVTAQHQRREMASNSTEVSVIYDYVQWSPEWPGPTVHVNNTIESPQAPRVEYSNFGMAINAIYQVEVAKLRVEAIGGVVFHRISQGRFENLYFQNAIMVSRGSIFASSALIDTRWKDTYQVGANLGLRLTIPVSAKTSLFAEGRYTCFEDTNIEQEWANLKEIQFFWNANERSKIEPLLSLRDFELNPSFFTLAAGVSLAF